MEKDTCPLFSLCGGCDYKGRYSDELRDKTEYVHSLFYSHCPTYETIGGNYKGYRNKVSATFGYDKKGRIISGLYIKGTHRLVRKIDCPLEFSGSEKILQTIRRLMKSYKMRPYDEDRMTGEIRHVLLRKGHKSNEVLVLLVVSRNDIKNLKAFAASIMDMEKSVKTVCCQVNNEKTSMLLSDNPVKTLAGPGVINSILFDISFKVSASSFFQINDKMTEVLYDMALYMARLSGKEKVLDAYSGTGTISMIASRKAKKVVAVENNRDAVISAIKSAKENHIDNVDFIYANASDFIKEEAKAKEKYDVVFLDPPRAGSDEKFLAALIRLKPKRIVYISCNAETAERDLRYLERFSDYRAKAVQPVDMFSRTKHVEVVILIEKAN